MGMYDPERPIQFGYSEKIGDAEVHFLCDFTVREGEILHRLMEEHPDMVRNQMSKLIGQARELAEKEKEKGL